MIARLHSFVLRGIDAVPCEVEADLCPSGLPRTTVVGLPDVAVRESMERVRTAILNSGYPFPHQRLTINLAPADVRKEGPVYDLPMAAAILLAAGTVPSDGGAPAGADLGNLFVAGELALDGRVRSVRGVLSLAILARQRGARRLVVPAVNAREAATVPGIDVLGVRTLSEVVELLGGRSTVEPQAPVDMEDLIASAAPAVDFADVRGQEAAKRALTVACAGAHNVLMIGPAGTGKTMMAKALPGVLPPLTREEALEVTRIYSCVGALPRDRPIVLERPVRTPHHSASAPAIVGGGSIPRPGDVSLAHRGVLFLDEMPEFSRAVLETMRQPLEDGCVTIARAQGSVRFPARFMLVGALNPTPRGGDLSGGSSPASVGRYLGRLSSPLIDRIDIHVEVPAVPLRELTGPRRGTSTSTIRQRVLDARRRQHARQGPRPNGELGGAALDRWAALRGAARHLLDRAMTEIGLSARAYDKVRRVARTLADLEGRDEVLEQDVAEAVQYRLLDRLLE